MANQRTGIFLCYRRQDSEDFTSRIFDELTRHFGREHIFKDVDSLLPGLDWQEHLDARLAQAAVAIVIIGEDWVDCRNPDGQRRLDEPDDHVCHEISRVLSEKIPVIPLLVGMTSMPQSTQLPESIRGLVRRQNFAVRRDQHFRNDARLLIENLERLPGLASPVGLSEVPPATPVPAERNVEPAPAPPLAALEREIPAGPPPPAPRPPAAANPPPRVESPAPIVEPLSARRPMHGLLFFIAWAASLFLLPVPWLGAWVQQQLLRKRGLPAAGWLAQTGWAAAPAMLVGILFCFHLDGGFGGARLRYWSIGKPTSEMGWLGPTYVSVTLPPETGTTRESTLVIEPELSAGPSDRFWFGVLTGMPLLALLGLQWNLLRPALRLSWLWFVPVPVLLYLLLAQTRSMTGVGETILAVGGLHTTFQACLLSLLPRSQRSQ